MREERLERLARKTKAGSIWSKSTQSAFDYLPVKLGALRGREAPFRP
jgi:uncharacterized protein (DUF736 family)